MKSSNYIVIAFFVLLVGSGLVLNLCALKHNNNPVEHSVKLEKFQTMQLFKRAQKIN